jgi:GntR family transcriptional regulator
VEIDTASPVPIYQQIVDRLATAVAAGAFKPGDVLPSVRQQAVALLVNPNTVQRAYEELQRAGMLAVRRGEAPVVANGALAVALARTTDRVRGTFTNGITAGTSAGLTPNEIDQLYDQAWSGARPRQPEAAT